MKKTYSIEVDCANCANLMEEAAQKTEGVASAVVNFMTQKMIVEFAEGADQKATMKAVLKACRKLCWHSRGNDNDQENAGCVRESAGGSEQALRLRAQAGAFRAPARVTFFFCQKKVTKENHSNLRFKNPLARGGFRRCGGESVSP